MVKKKAEERLCKRVPDIYEGDLKSQTLTRGADPLLFNAPLVSRGERMQM